MRSSGTWRVSMGVWSSARTKTFTDFALLRGAPPKFGWIRLGNCTTDDIAQLLRRHHEDIIRFNEQNEATVLELG